MKRAELLEEAEAAITQTKEMQDADQSTAYSLYAISCILLAKELREGGDVEGGESK